VPGVKVLFVMPAAHRHGGAENILWTYLRHVDRERIEPAVVFFGDGPFRAEVAGLGMSTHVLRPEDCPRPRIVSYSARLARIVRAERADVILSWMIDAATFASVAGVLAGRARRTAFWQANMPEKGPVERLAAMLPTRMVFLYSHATAAVQDEIWPHRPTLVVHPGVDEPERLDPAARDALRAELGLPAGTPVVGIAGRLMTWKGQHHVLRALAALRDRGHAVHGLIVGGDAYEAEPSYEPFLHRLTAELGLEEHVTFTGQVPDATRYIQLMDVAVNASDHEPFGIVLLEAMALGVAVVAVGAGGPAELIEDGVSGRLVGSADPELFAGAIEPMLADPALRERLAEGGRRRYQDGFTPERMVERITAALERIHDPVAQRPAVAA
jgi:glycosyltransferase involved in cell wall biosynthesis